MNFLRSLRTRISPPKISDPDFGRLVYQYISNAPHRSYWEAEWRFPPTGTLISIDLLGDESGPYPESRAFYFGLIPRFAEILSLARPQLDSVFNTWFGQHLPENMFSAVKLTGFGVEDARVKPLEWNISFETHGDRWLSITVPFVDDSPQEPTVDS